MNNQIQKADKLSLEGTKPVMYFLTHICNLTSERVLMFTRYDMSNIVGDHFCSSQRWPFSYRVFSAQSEAGILCVNSMFHMTVV